MKRYSIKKSILILIVICIGVSIIFIAKNIKEYNKESNLIQLNWHINLGDKPVEETTLFSHTDKFHGDGLKIIKLKFDSINKLKANFDFQPDKQFILNQFNNYQEDEKDRKTVTDIINNIVSNSNKYLFYSTGTEYDSLVFALNETEQTLIIFVQYM